MMKQYLFDGETYSARRRALAEAIGSGVILLFGNENSPINYKANYYKFRQDSNFLYYAGLDMPNMNLVIDIDNKKTVLFADEATIEDTIWTGPQESIEVRAEKVGIRTVMPRNSLIDQYADCDIHTLPPYRTEHYRLLQKVTEHADCSVSQSEPLIRAIVSQREIKTGEEIAQMEEALTITAQMHRKVISSVKPGMTEAALAGIAHGIAEANQGSLAYGIIMSKRGEILHNHDHSNVLQKGDLVLGDFGAENKMRYAGDITRTFPVAKKFSAKQKDVYEIVLEALTKATNATRAGQEFRAAHFLASEIIADGLKSMGLMKGEAKDAVQAGAHALFFPHGLGHMIGLDVHDMEGLGEDYVGYDNEVVRSDQFGTAYLRMGKKLKPGHVVTVEPGIYFIPALMDKWQGEGQHTDFINYDKLKEWRNFGGVRIEDNVLVTENGPRVLGPGIAKSVGEIEELRS